MNTDPAPETSAVPPEECVRLFLQTLACIVDNAQQSVGATAPELHAQRLARAGRAEAYERALQIATQMLLPLSPPADLRRSIDYSTLAPQEREAMQTWLLLHDLTPANTPSVAMFEFFPDANEWGVEQFVFDDDGGKTWASDGSVMTTTVRRPNRGPLPVRAPRRAALASGRAVRAYADARIEADQ